MYKKILLALPLCAFLAACATPYQSAGWMGGYSEMALNKDTYQVTFEGNSDTSKETVHNYMLRRGAELALKNGYPYFMKVEGKTDKHISTYTTPTTVTTTKNKDSHEKITVVSQGTTLSDNSYSSHMTIKMLHDNKEHPDAYEAKVVLQNFA